MKKPKTRKDKIKLLNEIQTGKVSIKDLQPMKYFVWFQDLNDRNYFTCHETGVRSTRENIENLKNEHHNTTNIYIEYTRGYTIL